MARPRTKPRFLTARMPCKMRCIVLATRLPLRFKGIERPLYFKRSSLSLPKGLKTLVAWDREAQSEWQPLSEFLAGLTPLHGAVKELKITVKE
jgi:hypothetical protein